MRAYNCLKRAGIQTVGDLVQRSESELNAIPNFGKRSTDEVKDALTRCSASLGRCRETSNACATGKQRHKLQP